MSLPTSFDKAKAISFCGSSQTVRVKSFEAGAGHDLDIDSIPYTVDEGDAGVMYRGASFRFTLRKDEADATGTATVRIYEAVRDDAGTLQYWQLLDTQTGVTHGTTWTVATGRCAWFVHVTQDVPAIACAFHIDTRMETEWRPGL